MIYFQLHWNSIYYAIYLCEVSEGQIQIKHRSIKCCGMNTPLAREMPFRWYRQPAISCPEFTVNKHISI